MDITPKDVFDEFRQYTFDTIPSQYPDPTIFLDTLDTDILHMKLNQEEEMLDDFLTSMDIYLPKSPNIPPQVAAVYRMAVTRRMLDQNNIAINTTKHCPNELLEKSTVNEQVQVLYDCFPEIKCVVFGQTDVVVEFDVVSYTHKDMFNTQVGQDATFDFHVKTKYGYQTDQHIGQLHLLHSNTLKKKKHLVFALTHLPANKPVLRSWFRFDEFIFGCTPTNNKPMFKKPTNTQVRQLLRYPKDFRKVPPFMDPTLAKVAYNLLLNSMETDQTDQTVLEACTVYATKETQVVSTPEQCWTWITLFFDVLYSYNHTIAQDVWEMYLLALMDNATFTMACIKSNCVETRHVEFGVNVETLSMDVLAQHKESYEKQLTKFVVTKGGLTRCKPVFRHFLVPTIFYQVKEHADPEGVPTNAFDLDLLLPKKKVGTLTLRNFTKKTKTKTKSTTEKPPRKRTRCP